MSTKLNLRIHRVVCVDETGGKWAEKFGNDEIYLGGFTLDANHNTMGYGPRSVYAHFDDGDVKTFSPPRVCATIDLGGSFNRTRNYYAGFLLIEHDSGNMASAVASLVKKVNDKVQEELLRIQQAREANSGGAGVAVVGTAVAVIWPLIKDDVVAYVKSKLSSWFGDEIFPLQVVSATLTSSDHTWNGQKTSQLSMREFRAHDGVYQIFYDWQLT